MNVMKRPPAHAWLYLVATSLLSASLALNVILALGSAGKFTDLSVPFEAGARFPVLAGTGLDGAPVNLTGSRPALISVFAPLCQWSRRNHGLLTTLADATAGRYTFFALAFDDQREPYLSSEVRYPAGVTVVFVDRASLDPDVRVRLGVTPQLIWLDSNMIVQRSWTGALSGDRLSQVERVLGVALPSIGPDVEREDILSLPRQATRGEPRVH